MAFHGPMHWRGIEYPPNPIRQLDDSLRADEERGREVYVDRDGIDTITTCNGSHAIDRVSGFFGGDGRTTFALRAATAAVNSEPAARAGVVGAPRIVERKRLRARRSNRNLRAHQTAIINDKPSREPTRRALFPCKTAHAAPVDNLCGAPSRRCG
jgi:hypothetical protein